MAKYFIDRPCFVEGRYIGATLAEPTVQTFPDSVAPSRTWKPLDKAAQAQLLKLGVKAEIHKIVVEDEPVKDESATMADMNKRLTDRSPV